VAGGVVKPPTQAISVTVAMEAMIERRLNAEV
jgi:hypothetical protein